MSATLSLLHLHRPASLSARVNGARPPLLVLLHGVGSNEQSMASIVDAFDARIEVLCVRSPITLGPNSFAWFHVTFTADGPRIVADEARAGWEQLAAFVQEATIAYDTDPTRAYLGGFSQGGIMSIATLLTAPSVVAGAIVMSGRLLPEVLPYVADSEMLRDKAVLLVHGTDDTKLGIGYAHDAKVKLSSLPVSLSYHEFPMGHQLTRESVSLVAEWISEQAGLS